MISVRGSSLCMVIIFSTFFLWSTSWIYFIDWWKMFRMSLISFLDLFDWFLSLSFVISYEHLFDKLEEHELDARNIFCSWAWLLISRFLSYVHELWFWYLSFKSSSCSDWICCGFQVLTCSLDFKASFVISIENLLL